MAIDIPRESGTLGLERDKFGLNANNKVVVRTEDESAQSLLNQILSALGGAAQVEAETTRQSLMQSTVTAIALPQNTIEFRIQAVEGSKFKLAFNAGDIALGNYWTVWPGNCEVVRHLFQLQTIYVETSKDDVIELVTFKTT